MKNSSSIQITQNDISWITSISHTSSIFAVLLCYFIGGKVSHRWILRGITTYYLIAWTVILCTSSVHIIMVCFWLHGIASGTTHIMSYVYMGEVASPKNREVLCISFAVAMFAGIQLEYLLSMFQNYYFLPILPILASIFALLASKLMLESPYYLASLGDNERALANLNHLNNRQDARKALADLETVKKYINERIDAELTKNVLQIILFPNNLKLAFIMIIVCGFSFINVGFLVGSIGSFLVKDFSDYVSGDVFVTVNTTTNLILPFFSIFILKKFNRRTLFKVGFPAAGTLHLTLAVCYYVESQNGNTVGWLAYAIVCLIVAFSILMKMTFTFALEVLKTEVFPHKLKVFYLSLMHCTGNWFQFVAVQSYFYIEPIFGHAFLMVCYGIISFVVFVIIYFHIEETKGKTLLQIRSDINKELERLI